jgi:hypothetical protein
MKVVFCDPDWIRTNGLLLRRQLLYPAELPDQNFYARSDALSSPHLVRATGPIMECEFTKFFHSMG